ncbi:type I-E CRISPR-associated protein Cse2/CasB [Streptomyces sp. DH8]|uniref:type I-E CRISPR-associated protein Cse2/CasB n=1 Tax=Streptomyces sp. DH8 TaxID=2857008 RepID=UPI001E3861B7|nr:type I-E CRISPR-associated protein Cse2/CasB [Streptomyces sp. DH8]
MTTTPTAPARLPAPADPVAEVVRSEIGRLQQGYLSDRSEAVAALARLRRGAGKDTATIPDLWGLLDTELLHTTPGTRPDEAEAAVFTAMTLYALHQQSRSTAMHCTGGDELGAAVRRLMPPGEIDEPVRKRFVRAGSAPTLTVLAARLREITLLLRGEDLSLDYALLAEQLYAWQLPGGRDRVRRSWGRSFHAHRPPKNTDAPARTPEETDQKDAS